MNLSGSTPVIIGSRITRVLSHHFNVGLRKAKSSGVDLLVLDVETGTPIFPSKGLSWTDVGVQIRAGKKVAARLDAPAALKVRKAPAKADGVKGGAPVRKTARKAPAASNTDA